MPSFLPFTSFEDLSCFALVLGRTAGIFTAIPMLGGHRVPVRIRVVLIFVMTLVMFPVIKLKVPELPTDSISLVILVAREGLVGITLGLLALVVTEAVSICGQIVAMQMGLSVASMFDPSMGQVPIMATFQSLLAMLLFFTLNIHHLFIRAMVDSYALVPLGSWHMSGELMQFLVSAVSGAFILGIKLAAPVMVTLLAANVALGIMARVFPQMNIFMLSLPLNIGLGFLALGLSLLVFIHTVQNAYGALPLQLKALLKLMA